ncbi:MAG: hypothetical protein EZS28_025466 [Streblomastix strix]|uniref:Uncharacterized protein n=1 Tax=Streblomastix strix TaxID=222440 RepID=A0A5J4V8Z9_9EUKA|nr:MAG: hypothetical protein EZS28_025466 [Streblomastix strix]
MGLDETLLNTYTGHARNSKSTNEYYVFAERLKDNEIATKLSDTRGQVEFFLNGHPIVNIVWGMARRITSNG